MTRLRWIFAFLVVALVVVSAVSGLSPKPEPAQKVQTVVAKKMTVTRTVRAAGKLEPLRKINVSSNITGTLLELKVGIGSEVKKGDFLAQIDTSRYLAQVEQQKAQAQAGQADVSREVANLSRAQNVLKRMEEAPDRVFNVGEREQARTTVRIAEAGLSSARNRADMGRASLSEARKSFDWATLRAPVDGTVLGVNHRVGERIRGSDFSEDVVLVIGTLDQMDVRIDVGEHDVVHIRPGQKATIEIDAIADAVMTGKVIDSGRDAIIKHAGTDNEVISYPVWVSLDSPPKSALSGMSAQVAIETETRAETLAVPIQAVTVRPRDEGPKSESVTQNGNAAPVGNQKLEKVVFVVKDDKVAKRNVTTGISSESHIEITAGLNPGEVIVEGPYRILARELKDGSRIELDKPEAKPKADNAAEGAAQARR